MDWWSESLLCQSEGCQGDTARKVVDPLPCHSQTELTEQEGRKSVKAPSLSHPLPAYTTPQVLLSNRFEMLEMEGEMSGEVREGLPRRELRLRW